MARNDTFRLSVPDPAPCAVQAATEINTEQPAGYAATAPDAAQPGVAEAAYTAPPAIAQPSPGIAAAALELELKQRLAQLKDCPYCRGRLSPIDQKMNRCFGCGKTLIVLDNPALTGPDRFVVRI